MILLWWLACGLGMGAPCGSSAACGDGSCLKGVCSGYGCESDDDCDNGYVCGSVAEIRVCVLRCASDDACDGAQTCHDVDDGTACL